MVDERDILEQAVSRLEEHRHVLGKDVVELSVAALQRKLVTLPPAPDNGQSLPVQTDNQPVTAETATDFWLCLRSNHLVPHLIGRELEHQLLEGKLEQVIQQQSAHLVTIMGQAGLGKSHLLYHFEQWLKLVPGPVLLLRGRAAFGQVDWPLSPLGALLASLLDLHLLDSQEVMAQKIRTGLRRYLPETAVSEAVAIVEHWLGLATNATAAYSPAHWLMLMARLLRSVVAGAEAAPQRPEAVVVLLEDLHRADDLALNLVEALFRQCRDLPLLLIGSTQPMLRSERPSWPTDIHTAEHTMLKLPPLSPIDMRHLVNAFLPHLSPVPLRLHEVLVAGGRVTPLYVREAIRLLQMEGRLEPDGPLWALTELNETNMVHVVSPSRGGRYKLPNSLVGLFERQIAAVSPLARGVLQKAALLGDWFWDTAVAYLEQTETEASEAQKLQLEEIAAVLQALVACGLLRYQPFPVYRGATGYMFGHPRLRQTVQKRMAAQERQAYQQRLARWQPPSGDILLAVPQLVTNRASTRQRQPV